MLTLAWMPILVDENYAMQLARVFRITWLGALVLRSIMLFFSRYRLLSVFLCFLIAVLSLLGIMDNRRRSHIHATEYLSQQGHYLYACGGTTLIAKWIDSSRFTPTVIRALPRVLQEHIVVEYYRGVYVNAIKCTQYDLDMVSDLYGVIDLVIYEIDRDCDLSFLGRMSDLQHLTICKGELSHEQIESLGALGALCSVEICDIDMNDNIKEQVRSSLNGSAVFVGPCEREYLEYIEKQLLK